MASGSSEHSTPPSLQHLSPNAVAYLKQVQETFKDDPGTVRAFMGLMEDLSFKKTFVTLENVVVCVRSMFKNHPHLIMGFNEFLPPSHQVQTGLPSVAEQDAMMQTVTAMEEFVKKLRATFGPEGPVTKALISILRKYVSEKSTDEKDQASEMQATYDMHQKVGVLLANHKELWEEFKKVVQVQGPVSSCEGQNCPWSAWDESTVRAVVQVRRSGRRR